MRQTERMKEGKKKERTEEREKERKKEEKEEGRKEKQKGQPERRKFLFVTKVHALYVEFPDDKDMLPDAMMSD
jgi:hypothetical protein